MKHLNQIMSLLDKSHSPFHVVQNMENLLKEGGFAELSENMPFHLEEGGRYYVKRNDSSIIAFIIPHGHKKGFRIAATHNDSPVFVLKPNPVLNKGPNAMLNVEQYGGVLYYTWFDRPLSFAGRVFYSDGEDTYCQLVDLDETALVIPSLAIHMRKLANDGITFSAAKDMTPMWLADNYDGDFHSYLKKKFDIKGDVLSFDLSLYIRTTAKLAGGEQDMLLSPRLDDLASSYSSLLAFLEAKAKNHIAVFASFDNEEVGSLTYQGANSDFLKNTLRRIGNGLGYNEEDHQIAQAESIMLSVDNAHANHPNYLDISDLTTHVKLNGGVVIKYNASQRYTTNGKSGAYVKSLMNKLGQPIQEYTNRPDIRGGSTLGNLSNAEVSLLSADIGIAQLAMHSCVEICGAKDIDRMVDLLALHYEN